MIQKILSILFLMLIPVFSYSYAEDWGKIGHRATAEIAETYLSKKTKRKINKLLDGHGLAFVANYADDIKSNPDYRKYGVWHYVNIPEGKTYEAIEKQTDENLIWAIQQCVKKLKANNTPKKEQQFLLKMLIHLVGDLHQPMHVGRKEDKGGNDIYLQWFNKSTNLHRVWDSDMLKSYEMSYTEIAKNQDKLTKEELKKIKKGTVVDWAEESQKIAGQLYNSVDEGDYLSYQYMYKWFPELRQQLQKGGIRLAVLLNEIFD